MVSQMNAVADGDADRRRRGPGSEGLLTIYCGAVKRCAPLCLKNCVDEDGAEPPCYRVVGYDAYDDGAAAVAGAGLKRKR